MEESKEHEVLVRYGCGEEYLYTVTVPTGMSVKEVLVAIESKTMNHDCHQCEIDRIVEALERGTPCS